MYHCFSISFFKILISLTMKFFHLWLPWLKSPFRLFCLIFLVIQQSGHSDSRWQLTTTSEFTSHTFSPSALLVSLKEDLLTLPPGSRSYGGGAAPLAANGFLPMALSSEKMDLDATLELMVSHVDPCWVLWYDITYSDSPSSLFMRLW